MKKCPFCAEEIQDAAIKCRYCGSELTGTSTRVCPFCSASIPAAAKVCPSCADDVSSGAAFSPGSGGTTPRSALRSEVKPAHIVAIVIVLGGVMYFMFSSFGSGRTSSPTESANSRSPVRSTPPTPSATNSPVLELQQWSWARSYDYAQVEGVVRNISAEPLRNVTAVILFYDKAGGFITSDDAVIDYNPILAGQVSPFKVLATWNPAMQSARVEFKDLLGPKLVHIERGK